ncbi:hypothetical protein GF360_00710 [candidate division WWE3 bacterium]|nr:hypothetical protein [candidate division WWE3 bacterium]
MSIIFSSFIKEPKRTSFDGEDHDERIIYILRRSFITNLDWIAAATIMLLIPFALDLLYANASLQNLPSISGRLAFILNIFWYLITFGFIFQSFLNWFFNVYIITNKKIVDVDFHGILYKNISEASLKRVEDVTSNITGALRVIFNYGHVYIQTSAEKREFDFEDVANPAKIRDLIADLSMEVKNGA